MKPVFGRFAVWLCLFAFAPLAPAQAPDPADAILGVWHTTDDKSQVKIVERNHKFFALITGITKPNWPANDKGGLGGKPRTDRNNPDPKLRDRPLLGIEIMHDFNYAGKNLWEDGKIYDPESGKTYRCKMKLVSPNKLEVHGYIGISLIGRTVTWTR